MHEAGHQFWYGIVATNEFEHAWMDEGFNTFSTARALEQFFGPQHYAKRYFGGFVPWVFDDLPLSRATDGNRLSGYRDAPTREVQSTPTWRYWPGTAGAITYNKTALWLNTLERMLGWDTLQRILVDLLRALRVRSTPSRGDFFAVANEVSGRDLTWFFDQVYRSSNVFDYARRRLHERARSDRGYFGDAGRQKFSADERPGDVYRTTLVVRRGGDGVFPVSVRVVVREQPGSALAVGRARALEDVRSRIGPCAPSRPRSIPSGCCCSTRTTRTTRGRSRRRRPRPRASGRSPGSIWLQDHLLTYGFFI